MLLCVDISRVSILLALVLRISCEICIDSYHRITNYEATLSAFDRKEFRSADSGNYTSIVFDSKNDRLIVGGKNHVFHLLASTLQEDVVVKWKPERDYEKCRESGLEKNVCQNYIQYVNIVKEKLYICGTYASYPTYNVTDGSTGSAPFMQSTAYGACATPNPNFRMVGSMTEFGELIAGTFQDKGGKKAVIAATYLQSGRPPRIQLSTHRWTKKALFDPTFVASVSVGDSVYIFFNEQAPERGSVFAPTVARICKTDNGAGFMGTYLFTTLRKARIRCTVEDMSDLQFSEIVHVTYDKNSQMFIAVFATSSKNFPASAICAFQLSEFNKAFDGPFLEKVDGKQQWRPLPNGAFLRGCDVNHANLSKSWNNASGSFPQLPPGKQPTNYLDIVPTSYTIEYQLMNYPVLSSRDAINHAVPLVRLTYITVDLIKVDVGGTIQNNLIYYIATASGSVLVLYSKTPTSKPCIIDEIRLCESDTPETIHQMIVNKDRNRLFVSTDVKVVSLKIYACERYSTKQACIEARDPRCGWSPSRGQCVPSNQKTSDFEQDLSVCPNIKGQWDDWSDWFPCVQEGTAAKYCLCRSRSCLSCDPSHCNIGESVEVKNCSGAINFKEKLNNVTNIEDWKLTGVIDGAFSEWGVWSDCHTGKCGKDFQTRTRTCTNPEPRNGGRYCVGDTYECQNCAAEPERCLAQWSAWSDWGDCIEGSFLQRSFRTCSKDGACPGRNNRTRACSPDGIIFNAWSKCYCHYGMQYRSSQWVAGCTKQNQVNCETTEFRNCSCNETTIVVPDPIGNQVEALRTENLNGVHLRMRDIVIAACGVLVACFIICTVVVVLLTRRHKRELKLQEEEEKSGISPDLLKTPLRADPYLNGGKFNFESSLEDGLPKASVKQKKSSSKRNSKRLSNGDSHVELNNDKGARTTLERPLLHDATKV